MKKLTLFFILCCIGISAFAQIGINTEEPRPRAALDINGSFKTNDIILPELPEINDIPGAKDRFVFLVQDQTTEAIKFMDLTASEIETMGLSTLITYKIANVNQDWILNFDTKINTEDYSLVVLSAYFDRNIKGKRAALPVARAKVQDGTWRLEADYSSVGSHNASNGTWVFTCVVHSKNYVKILGTNGVTTVNMNGNSTGTATTAIVQ